MYLKYPKAKKSSLFVLGITSVLLSRLMFVFFDDPEGPNLLIVLVTAFVVFSLSLTVYSLKSPMADSKKLFFGNIIAGCYSLYFLPFSKINF